jgi:hypothetical protein
MQIKSLAWLGRLCFFVCDAFACVAFACVAFVCVASVPRVLYNYASYVARSELPRPLDYVARAALEWNLTQALLDLPPHRVVVIEGPRLSGKTVLVQKVMAKMRSHYIVVDCHGSKAQVEESIRKVAGAGDDRPAEDVLRGFLGVPSARGPTLTLAVVMMDVVKEFVDWASPQECAIVLDNLDDGDAAKWLLETARTAGRKVLVTTQDAQVLRSCKALTGTDWVVRVDAMEPLEALDLALARLRGTEMLSTVIRDNDTLPPKLVSAIDTICRDYCDYRPAFVSLVFAKFSETARGSSEMEAWVRENFTQLVTTGPKRGSKMNHISVDVVHNARRESLSVAEQAVYDDILGSLAAMGTTNCSDVLLRRVCEDHGLLIVGDVLAHRRRWHVLRDVCDGQRYGQYYVHRLDLEGVTRKPILAASVLLTQFAKDKKMTVDPGVRTEWQRALTAVQNNSAPNEKAVIVNLVRTLASHRLSRNTNLTDGVFLEALRTDDGFLLRTAFKEQSRATGGAKSQRPAVPALTAVLKGVILDLVRTVTSYRLSRNTKARKLTDDEFLEALRTDDGFLLRTALKLQSRAAGGAKS